MSRIGAERVTQSCLGAAAVEEVRRSMHGVLVGLIDSKVAATPLAAIVGRTKSSDLQLFELARTLAK